MRKILIALTVLGVMVSSCSKTDFADAYADPSKISETTVEKQYSGFLQTNKDYVLPAYWNYFVVLRTTLHYYTQAVGWVNVNNQYVPGMAAISARWGTYYSLLAQYREMQKVYNKLTADDQAAWRIYMITATIYLYDATEKMVDLHGDIPFSEAGMLSTNSGDYNASLPKYDGAETIYTTMLDDLKKFSSELSTITVPSGILTGFKTQDYINKGDVSLWRRYNNSLRLRMLSRVSDAASFKARADGEIAEILNNPTTYPLVSTNANNIQIKVIDLNSPINSKGFRTGLEDWNGNVAGKVMIDHMKNNADPRLRAVFEPGLNAAGVYEGVDQMAPPADQTKMIADGKATIYNRSTLSRNEYFPGVLINAAEVNLLAAEGFLKAGKAAEAKAAYEAGITASINFYYDVRKLSADNVAGALTPLTATEITDYLAKPAISWDAATTTADKIKLIAMQKWLHFNVIQSFEGWAEMRRHDWPAPTFWVDGANAQTLPPQRFLYDGSEKTYNLANYSNVAAKDNLTTKIFWDVK
ncbi:MAG TPA: SusD/RagB family nutrient-binding outer membrane lipoprotein [Chitinophagaceae bacterium]|nr:SusD/RagB family nutrient-binding outer membrane lipoprotein [Chitinophagaceae bacterium]